MELVSVIVPIYNVEKYLEKCIESILNQTYKNLEIILVNDGSTDNSYDICLKYKEKDSRVIIVNKSNGGLSSARNKGIECATGEYYLFVDSDDYISEYMIEKLLYSIHQYNADIVCCNYDFCDEKSNFIKKHTIDIFENQIYNSKQANERLLYNKFYRCFAWNKMYNKKLFYGIRYPIGQLYEDIYTTFSLINKAKKIVFIPESLYCYRVRRNSITRNTFDNRLYDILIPIRKIISETNDNYIIDGCLLYYNFFINDIIKAKKWDEDVYKEFKNIVKKELKNIRHNKYFSFGDKLKLICCYKCKNLYKAIILFKIVIRRIESKI